MNNNYSYLPQQKQHNNRDTFQSNKKRNWLRVRNRADAKFAKVLSAILAIIAGYYLHFLYDPIIYTAAQDGVFLFIQTILDFPMKVAIILPAILTGGAIMFFFMVPGVEFLAFAIPSFIFWFYLFYGLAQLVRKAIGRDKHAIFAFIPAIVIVCFLLSPILSLNPASEEGLAKRTEKCLQGEFRYSDPSFPNQDLGGPSRCFEDILDGLVGKTSSSEEVIDFCVSLSNNQIVNLPEFDLRDEQEYLPQDITHQEYCIFKAQFNLNPIYRPSFIENEPVFDFHQRYKIQHFPELEFTHEAGGNRYYKMPDEKGVDIGGAFQSYDYMYKRRLCQVFAEKIDKPEVEELCVENFVRKDIYYKRDVLGMSLLSQY